MGSGRPSTVRTALLTTTGAVLAITAMEAVGRTEVFGPGWPPLSHVLEEVRSPGRGALLGRAFAATARAAGTGLLTGSLIALAVAVLGAALPVLQPGLDRLAAVVNAIPLIALGPLLFSTVGRDGSPAVIAALACGFVVFVAAASGLSAASPAHRDVLAALGASRRTTLLRLQLPAAVPMVLDALTLAAPAAVLGAVVGEWFGASRGLGLLLVSSMQNYQTELLWAAGLAAALQSIAAYLLLGAVRAAVAWRFR
ncbi:ABC transporter permease [Streptomyces sp. NPDC059224]|uniref:ABC transporter permease n=1 Tax=Streptomyces sp. NPDC059224 TaxID=3346775 RepID=UPI003675E67F